MIIIDRSGQFMGNGPEPMLDHYWVADEDAWQGALNSPRYVEFELSELEEEEEEEPELTPNLDEDEIDPPSEGLPEAEDAEPAPFIPRAHGGRWVDERPTEIDWPPLIAARRWQAEASGIHVSGARVDTSRDSQGLITGAALSAILHDDYSLRWKTAEGDFVELNRDQVLALATAVRQHVQRCFDREADLLESVADGSITEEMIDQGWPDA